MRVVSLCALLVALLATPARAADVPGDLQRILRPWLDRQAADGAFTDWPGARTGGGGGYAESVLGLALATEGQRTGDAAMAAAGERAVGWALDHPASTIAPRQSVFEDLGLATTLDTLGPALPADLAARLRERVTATLLVRRVGLRYTNHALTEALRIVTARHAGAPITTADTLRAANLLGTVIPAYGRSYGTTVRGIRSAVLSDPAANPLAYHALTLAFTARAAEILGPSAPPDLRAVVLRLAEGSAGLMAPDGDVAYWGRSQEQAWALPFTAYGAQVAARLNPAAAGRMRTVAQRAIGRLEALHVGPDGLRLTPGAGEPAPDGDVRAGLDGYASLPAYTGLTALGLHWLDPAFLVGPGAPAGADVSGAARNGNHTSAFATVRSASRWWAVKLRPAGAHTDDGRTDFGLIAFKRQRPDGAWTDVLPLRPYDRRTACVRGTCTTAPPTLGPAAVTSAGLARPIGDTLRTGTGRHKRWVTIRGRWVKPDGTLHAPLLATYQPAPEGVRVTWSGFTGGQAFELTGLFLERDGPVCRAGDVVGNAGGTLRLPPSEGLRLVTGLSSGAQRGVTAATATVRAPTAAPLSAVYSDLPLACP